MRYPNPLRTYKARLMLGLIAALLVMAGSCFTQPRQPINIKTYSVNTVDGKEVINDVFSTVKDEYFEIGLYSMSKSAYFTASKKLIEPKVGEPFTLKGLIIVDDKKEPLKFENSTDFLNYMAKAGYELVTQNPKKFFTEYTFKKKN